MALTYPVDHVTEDPDVASVFVLGAGFSKAISDRMPTTDELGNAVVAADESPEVLAQAPFENGRFETWLSRLAEDQPDLEADENLRNRATFLRLSRLIRDILSQCQEDASEGVCDWLIDLMSTWHARHATVLTLNYDTLVEDALQMIRPWNWQAARGPVWDDILSHLPPRVPMPGTFDVPSTTTFGLFKLHGSLNWYTTSGLDTAPVYRWTTTHPKSAEEVRRYLPDSVPFVVPPAATKSSYYRSPVIHEIWQRAAASLRTAQRMALLGYSLPPADLVVSGMISDACRSRAPVVDVVNPCADDIAARVKLLLPGSEVNLLPEEDCIARYVGQYVDGAARGLVRALISHAEPSNANPVLLVGWSPDSCAAVTDSNVSDSVIELSLEDLGTGRNRLGKVLGGPGRQREAYETRLLRYSDLKSVLSDGRQLVAVMPSSQRIPIVAAAAHETPTHWIKSWQVLVPSRPLGFS